MFSEEKRRKSWRNDDSSEGKIDPRMNLLRGSLKHVNRKGWTVDALVAAAHDLSLPPVVHGMFPRGAAEIAEYWMRRGNENLQEHLMEKLAQNKSAVAEAESTENVGGDRASWEELAKDTVVR